MSHIPPTLRAFGDLTGKASADRCESREVAGGARKRWRYGVMSNLTAGPAGLLRALAAPITSEALTLLVSTKRLRQGHRASQLDRAQRQPITRWNHD